jgi:putative exporter of polyketide antibiotics
MACTTTAISIVLLSVTVVVLLHLCGQHIKACQDGVECGASRRLSWLKCSVVEVTVESSRSCIVLMSAASPSTCPLTSCNWASTMSCAPAIVSAKTKTPKGEKPTTTEEWW